MATPQKFCRVAALTAGAALLAGAMAHAADPVIQVRRGFCAPIVYVGPDGKLQRTPPAGVEPIRVERVDPVMEFAYEDGTVAFYGPNDFMRRPVEHGTAHQVVIRGGLSTITIVNRDGAGEGLNDMTARAPEGGNAGTTLGAQRLNSLMFAASQLGDIVESNVTILVDAEFNALFCTPASGTLGSAGPNNFFRDFSGAPLSSTFYAAPLADKLRGTDNDPGQADITAEFNSSVNGSAGCLSGTDWYYGFDGNPPGGDLDFTNTALHEFIHGLGFVTLVDTDTGALGGGGFNDAFMLNLFDEATGRAWSAPAESDANRAASAISVTGLTWNGALVNAGNSFLSAGNNGAGRTRMYAPNPSEPGSSVSHWDTSLTPNELMEPFDTPANVATLTNRALGDMGWTGLVPVELSAFSVE
jgi:hypothetical protein